MIKGNIKLHLRLKMPPGIPVFAFNKPMHDGFIYGWSLRLGKKKIIVYDKDAPVFDSQFVNTLIDYFNNVGS